MKKVYVTRKIPQIGIKMLRDKGYEVDVSPEDRPLTKKELIEALSKKQYDGVLSLLTDTIDGEVMDAVPTVKIFANYAIGFNNFNVEDAKKRGVALTNTPGGGADRVAEHTWALILALSCRIVEGDTYVRTGKYSGWDPMLLHGTKLAGKTLGIIGTGRIGADVAHRAKNGFEMKVVYYDVKRNEQLEKDFGAVFYPTVEEVLKVADVVSLHVPLLDSTRHLINDARLKMMKSTAYLINTARGPVIDENALVAALSNGTIRGAGIDVFEFEPKLAEGLAKLPNVVMTPHIASGTEEARIDMATLSAGNIISVLEGNGPKNSVIS
jgi:glyoxylate reductase